jgi:hypothetical protein
MHRSKRGRSTVSAVPSAPVREADAPLGRSVSHPRRWPVPRIATEDLDWDALERAIRACSACPLHERRTMAVPGVGDRQADWLFVGEGPGAEEDQRGEPFRRSGRQAARCDAGVDRTVPAAATSISRMR